MSNFKYYYNPKTCQYERARWSVKDILWYVAGLVTLGLVFCGAIIAVHDSLMESETEKALRAENKTLEKHKPVLEEQLAAIESTLSNLKSEDKTLYAKVFNSELPQSQATPSTLSKEQILLADASGFKNLMDILRSKSEALRKTSANTNLSFGNTIHISKDQLDLMSSIPSTQPVANTQLDLLVSGFGERINPFHKGKYNHPGVDFAAARGTEVFVTAKGKVVTVSRTSVQAGYGNYVDVDHGNGFVTRYAHLDEIKVQRGQTIPRGTTIGTVGSSGGSIAPHLHYEVIRDGEPVDPARYLMEGLSSEQHAVLLKLSSKQNQSLD
ncbi:M23 family metallopeptidase [Chryseolinea lacunae]|uniref:M23 family metallopeptidase n=1 Tax=Chryseolinea lacunae TaxID=2801331 RepID=A0ABS1KWZ6_9BACT|nr:M23 family metallopeptidase [Chryseolinea lacunae]MBL0743792.1 M23 family metallopeptidase [Chryseolinea lacunae]